MATESSISIHAPRVGSDEAVYAAYAPKIVFQSTLPVWGATAKGKDSNNTISIFQSTLPVWGATY